MKPIAFGALAGAILNQMFIRGGHMTIDDLKAPYA